MEAVCVCAACVWVKVVVLFVYMCAHAIFARAYACVHVRVHEIARMCMFFTLVKFLIVASSGP